MAIGQETWKFKSHHGTYKASLRGAPGYPDKPAATSEDQNCIKTNTDTKRKDFIQNPGWVTTSHVDMSNTKVKYCIVTKGTTNHQLQTDPAPLNNTNRCSKCGDTTHHVGFTCPAKKYQCKACHNLDTLPANVSKESNTHSTNTWPKAHQIQVNEIYDSPDSYPSDVSSSEDSFCLQVKIKWKWDGTQKVPRPTHLITNIVYQLKQHHTRNQYLRARIDTGAEVNLMPVSVYRLIYHDHDLIKLTPSQLKIGTYTTDTVKILGTSIIYLIHPDSKKLTETIFYIASNEGNVLLSLQHLSNPWSHSIKTQTWLLTTKSKLDNK